MMAKNSKNGYSNGQELLVKQPAAEKKKKAITSKKAAKAGELPVAEEEQEVLVQINVTSEQVDPEIEANKSVFYEYFKLEYAKSVAKYILTPIEKYYFRAEFIGFDEENYPERNDPNRPLIFASNHSGMAFPWDAIIFASGLIRIHNYNMSRAVRGLSSPMLSKTKLMNPFLIPNFWKRAGGIDATTLNFDTMMHFSESNILIYPEGVEGIGKGFNKKYQLQKLSTSSLRMSIKYKTDIIPFATVNAEYVNPYAYSIEWINQLVQKAGIPFLPLGITTLLVLLQPWMFYFAFPAKLIYVRGRRIKPYEYINKPFEEITYQEFSELRDFIHSQMQLELEDAVRHYGKKPYHWMEFLMTLVQNWRKIPYFMPVFWPILFLDHERRFAELQQRLSVFGDSPEDQAKKDEIVAEEMATEEEDLFTMVKNAATTIFKNPQILLFYVPVFGLAPTIMQGYSKIGDQQN